MTDLTLFPDPRDHDAALRAKAWRRCLHLTNIAVDTRPGTVEHALAGEALATARLAKDIADGLADQLGDATGNRFCGEARDHPLFLTPKDITVIYDLWRQTATPTALRAAHCPTCHAHAGDPCTSRAGRPTAEHGDRTWASYKAHYVTAETRP